MLKRFVFCVIIFALSISNSFAQDEEKENRDFEIFVGYTNSSIDVGNINDSGLRGNFNKLENLPGIEVSGVKNITRYVGIKGDFSAAFKERTFNRFSMQGGENESAKVDIYSYNFLGGVQFKDNRKKGSRVRPFGHALVGVAHVKTALKSQTTNFCNPEIVNCNGLSDDKTAFAAVLGGGIDVKINKRFSIRAFQVDYNPTRFSNFIPTIGSRNNTQHNFRFSTGIIFH